MNRYAEMAEILAIVTTKVDKYGRIGGLKKYRGKSVRVLILVRDPAFQPPASEHRRL